MLAVRRSLIWLADLIPHVEAPVPAMLAAVTALALTAITAAEASTAPPPAGADAVIALVQRCLAEKLLEPGAPPLPPVEGTPPTAADRKPERQSITDHARVVPTRDGRVLLDHSQHYCRVAARGLNGVEIDSRLFALLNTSPSAASRHPHAGWRDGWRKVHSVDFLLDSHAVDARTPVVSLAYIKGRGAWLDVNVGFATTEDPPDDLRDLEKGWESRRRKKPWRVQH